MATAYYCDTRKKRYTIEFGHDDCCEDPLFDQDRIVTFTGRRTSLSTDVSRDVWDEAQSNHGDEIAFLLSVYDDWAPVLSLYSGGAIGGVLYLDKEHANTKPSENRELAEAILAEYSRWLAGDCWGYSIFDEQRNEVESCWGFVGREWCEENGNAELARLSC